MAPFREQQAKIAATMAPFLEQQAKMAAVMAPFREQQAKIAAALDTWPALKRLQADAARAIAPLVVNDGSPLPRPDPVADPASGWSRLELAHALVIGLWVWDQLRSIEDWEDLSRAVLTLPLALAIGLLIVSCSRPNGD